MVKLSPIFLLLLFLLVSCGKPRSGSKKIVPLKEQDIEFLLENQQFECASLEGGTCPDGLARVFILNPADPNNSALCTGFLTASNKLVTNNHCLSSLAQCQSTYLAIYQSGSYQIARCRSIIKTLADSEILNRKILDVTVLELDRHLSIKPFRQSLRELPNDARVSSWVIDHLSLYSARMTELECRFRGERFSLEFSSCPAISGNSGSPVLNSNGLVIGVSWGSTLGNNGSEHIDLRTRRNLSAYSFATDVKYFDQYFSP